MTEQRHVRIGDFSVGNDLPWALIAGPCAIESCGHALETAAALIEMTSALAASSLVEHHHTAPLLLGGGERSSAPGVE